MERKAKGTHVYNSPNYFLLGSGRKKAARAKSVQQKYG